MRFVLCLASLALILLILVDCFQAMVLPRRVTWTWRPTRLFYRGTWAVWRWIAQRFAPGRRRQTFLSVYGPLSLLALFATWVVGLIVGFGLLHWSLGTPLATSDGHVDLPTYLYLSGTTLFTLGYGDVTPLEPTGRVLAVAQSGIGFGFLALVIGYLPVLYQAFSRREVMISLLDARAGSPPSAGQLLLRLSQAKSMASVDALLAEWERWAAELLESHLSFPVLSYYRSQHDNQSWLAALSAILDTCSILLAGVKDACPYQAQLTFAMARHAAVDLALVFRTPPQEPDEERLPRERLIRLRAELSEEGVQLRDGEAADRQLDELRALYEPFLAALGRYFLFALPLVVPEKPPVDNWQTSAWTSRTPGIGRLPGIDPSDEHFD
jgi:Ion channel